MFTVANRIYVNADYSEKFEHTFLTRAGLVDKMPGFLYNQVLRPVNPGDPYIILTYWENRRFFDDWVNSESFIKGHARSGTLPKETYSGPSKLEVFTVIQDSRQPDLVAETPGEAMNFHG